MHDTKMEDLNEKKIKSFGTPFETPAGMQDTRGQIIPLVIGWGGY